MKRAAALGALLLFSVPARADDKATADVLFLEAQKLIAQGRFGEACPKLADSQRLDPGIGTALYLGDCYEKLHKTASAWGSFRDALALAERADDKRAAVAKRRADQLEPVLARVTLTLAEGARCTQIERNDKRVAPSELGVSIPVDPGPITVTCRSEGRQPWERTVTAEDGRAIEVVLESGAPIPVPPPAPATDRSAGPSPIRWVGLGVGALGLVGVGVGAALAVSAKSTYDVSNQPGRCDPATDQCTSDGLKMRRDARSSADVATAMFVVGGALVAAGVGLFVFAPSKRAALAPAVGPTYAGGSLAIALE